jgi:hypothetical protein
MKKSLLLAGALLALTAAVANAQLNLNYTDCVAGGLVSNRTSACTSNTGSFNIIGSFIAPAGITNLAGTEGVLDFQSASAALPPWWQFGQAGSCRQTAASVQYNTPGASCVDYYGSIPGGALGGFGITWSGNRSRIKTVAAVDIGATAGLVPGDEVYAFTLRITNVLTTGTGACAGCLEPVCIVFNSLKLAQAEPLQSPLLAAPADAQHVTWQGGAIGGLGCPGATPATKSSWGQVKSLYR